ncbi:TolC family protein [Novosphingobium sp. FSW06-99]|uniref:TolC family protein n=1 Tax=Novosphingobium sp. FSW06-99 TaxID=1739113 RepID=UPI000A86F4F4|nr:TolC family protein [Novosphingobium sp. FSW06-99]
MVDLRVHCWLAGILMAAVPVPGAAATADRWVLAADPSVGPLPDGPAIDPAQRYALADLIDLAERLNPETRIAWDQAREALSAEGLAKSAFLPQLTAAVLGGYANGSSYTAAYGIGGTLHADTSGAIGVVNLQWLLFDFGERAAALRASDARRQFGDLHLVEAHQRLIHAVSLAYYAHMAARARLAGCAQAVVDAQAIEASANARYHRGIGTVIEVDQAHQASAEAALMQVEANGAASDSYMTLLAAMGLSPLNRITIADLPDTVLAPHLLGAVDDVVNAALARRPDVQQAYAAHQASVADAQAASAAQRPKLFVSATGSYAGGDLALNAIPPVGGESPTVNLTGHHWGGTILGGVSVPLYDGGARRSVVEGARDRADAAQAAFERTKLEAARQIATAHNQLATALEAGTAAQSLLRAAQTTFDAATAAYRAGVGATSEVQLAQRQLISARNLATDARYRALSAAATLALAVGNLAGGD